MAATGLLALLDDITTILDDIAAMSKIAAQKTAGIAGDDLAVNANVVYGIDPKRELPIIWAVAKGSFKNKALLIPGALALNAAAPWGITPLLMAGGAFLCYEGVEKVLHKEQNDENEKHHQELTAAALSSAEVLLNLEKDKIKQAINTDLILSAEIVAVTLGAVATASFLTQIGVLTAVGVGMTIGIYGLVAGIVKIDDFGLHLAQAKGHTSLQKLSRMIGGKLVRSTPYIMKTLSVIGTAAMFAVGGGIILHGTPPAGHALAEFARNLTSSGFLQGAIEMLLAVVSGALIGLATLGAVKAMHKPFKNLKRAYPLKRKSD